MQVLISPQRNGFAIKVNGVIKHFTTDEDEAKRELQRILEKTSEAPTDQDC